MMASGFRRSTNSGPLNRLSSGQATVETAIVITVLLFALVLGIQFAVIGEAVLALNHATYEAARYAAINPNASQSDVYNYMLSISAPPLTSNNGANLTIALNPTTTPRVFGSSVSVSSTFNAANVILIPNPFLGVSIPTSFSSTATAMSE
jgi:Flp pilus assembly protein TadG